MIKINEVSVGFPEKIANNIAIMTMPIPTNSTSCSTYYELFNVSEIVDSEGNINSSVIRLADGNSPITEEQFTAWGQEMSYIEDIVLENLGLTRNI